MIYQNEATISDENLLELGYKKYEGYSMDIYYNKVLCKHAAKCVSGNPDVFEVGRRPWIITNNGSNEENKRVVNQCPTGALKYREKEDYK